MLRRSESDGNAMVALSAIGYLLSRTVGYRPHRDGCIATVTLAIGHC